MSEQVKVTCAFCKTEFYKKKSKLRNSKSGIYFCCRKHQHESLKIENNFGCQPKHYNNGVHSYRAIALRIYGKKCEICDYHEEDRILEVHHIDGNRKNSNISNLIVLCPNHHKFLTMKLGILVNRKMIYPGLIVQ